MLHIKLFFFFFSQIIVLSHTVMIHIHGDKTLVSEASNTTQECCSIKITHAVVSFKTKLKTEYKTVKMK